MNIPIADPYPSHTENLTINLDPHMAKIDTKLISCKGVKCLQNDNAIILKSPVSNESPKLCSKCIIS